MTVGFKDHFSARPDDYAQYRPTYPDELFEYLAAVVEERSVTSGPGQRANVTSPKRALIPLR